MSFEQRKEAAMRELKESGICKFNTKPPALIILWALGIKAKPPHYNSFLKNMFSMALWFAATWGILMWFLQWSPGGLPIPSAIASALFVGVLFGATMATYYKLSAQKHRLSKWVNLPSGDSDA